MELTTNVSKTIKKNYKFNQEGQNSKLVHKPKYQIWCESDIPCDQDSTTPI